MISCFCWFEIRSNQIGLNFQFQARNSLDSILPHCVEVVPIGNHILSIIYFSYFVAHFGWTPSMILRDENIIVSAYVRRLRLQSYEFFFVYPHFSSFIFPFYFLNFHHRFETQSLQFLKMKSYFEIFLKFNISSYKDLHDYIIFEKMKKHLNGYFQTWIQFIRIMIRN